MRSISIYYTVYGFSVGDQLLGQTYTDHTQSS